MRFFAVEVLSISAFLVLSCLSLFVAAVPTAIAAEPSPVLPTVVSAALGHASFSPGPGDGQLADARHFRPGTSVAVGVIGAFALLQGAPRMALLISL